MMKNRGIAFKLIALFTVSSSLIFLLVFGFNYYSSRRMIEKNAEEIARNLTLSTVNRIETITRSVQKVPELLAYFMEHNSYNKEELLRTLKAVVEKNSEIYGSTPSYEPYAFDKKIKYFAPYYYKDKGNLRLCYLDGVSYQYLYWDWYQIPKELNRPYWTEPFFDEGAGNILMATYAVPFYKTVAGKKQFMGVVTADVSLEWLRDIVSSIKILKTGYGYLISKNGMFVTHPQKELIMNETIFSVAEAQGNPTLREIGRKMIKGESGFSPFHSIVTGKLCFVYYAPIPSTGWSLAVLFPQDELMADVTRLNRIVVGLGVTGVFLLAIAVVLIARSITKPLRAMAAATETIATGNLDAELPPVKSGDEVGRLTEAFEYMKQSLKVYIQQLTETTAAKERIESELNIAHEIQMSILPKIFPPFPHRPEFDIYAIIEPAREVGGDFYDFYEVDDDHLCFVMADVSGKGVPASLFMAVAKTLIKANACQGFPPNETLARVNNELSRDNDSAMFVTVFCGVMHTKTGEVLYANGGHNPPLLLRNTGEITFVETAQGVVVGALDDMVYTMERLVLQPGESLFLYTDGVTEAMNSKEELFGEQRLIGELTALRGKPIKEIICTVKESVMVFSEGMPQSDDITMMILTFRGDTIH
ncbi:MAG: SpoIIE family protein phosphatase [Proteobacteria bacterium]|nr:SpoIIE family protein phosphatase [Pseudomonadota bacterium]